VYGSWP